MNAEVRVLWGNESEVNLVQQNTKNQLCKMIVALLRFSCLIIYHPHFRVRGIAIRAVKQGLTSAWAQIQLADMQTTGPADVDYDHKIQFLRRAIIISQARQPILSSINKYSISLF